MFRRPGHRFVPDILAVSLPGIETSNTPLLSEGAPSAYILERRRTPLYNAGAPRRLAADSPGYPGRRPDRRAGRSGV